MDNTYKNTLDRLAGWVSALTPEKPPAAVQLIAQTCLIDTVGVAIAGSAMDVSRSARAVAIEGGIGDRHRDCVNTGHHINVAGVRTGGGRAVAEIPHDG